MEIIVVVKHSPRHLTYNNIDFLLLVWLWQCKRL